MSINSVKVGDKVTRNLCGAGMELKVTEIDDDYIYCGPWKFSKQTGGEVDEELGWDGYKTGSYLTNE